MLFLINSISKAQDTVYIHYSLYEIKSKELKTENINHYVYKGDKAITVGKVMFSLGAISTIVGSILYARDNTAKGALTLAGIGSLSMFISIPIWLGGIEKKLNYHTHKYNKSRFILKENENNIKDEN